MRNFLKICLAIVFIFSSQKVNSQTLTMPTSLTADTSDFVLLSSSGTTPSISGFSDTLLVTIVASAGNVKVTTTTNLLKAAGYCGYSSDASSEPTDCTGNSLDEVGFRGSQEDINTALATISFKGDGSTGSPTITVSITPTGSSYFSGNGHYYQVYNSNAIRWANAKTLAESKTFNGLSGYLATIESAEENAFIFSKISQNAWIGASDSSTYTSNSHAQTEGTWEWVSGPSNGKTFYCQLAGFANSLAAHADCTVHGDTTYNNWDTAEPNDFNGVAAGDEDCGHIKGASTSNGKWNDFPCTHNKVDYYVVEFGGTEGETATVSGQTTLTINSVEASGSTFDPFDDKQVKGIAKGQLANSKRFMFNTTNQVMRRMEQFRRTGENTSTGISDLRLVMLDEENNVPPELVDHYVEEYKKVLLAKNNISDLTISGYLIDKFDIKTNNWAFWSVGSISKGRFHLGSDGELGRQNRTEGFTLGADISYNDRSLFGIAFRQEDDMEDIGNDGTRFLARSQNISFYNTWHPSEKNFFDFFIGYGETDFDVTRIVDLSNLENTLKGELKGKQYFGSLKYNLSDSFKNFNINNYSRYDFGFVRFNEYAETGNSNSKLFYDERDVNTASFSIGSSVNYDINFVRSVLIPYLKIDYREDLTGQTEIKARLVGNSTKYSTKIGEDFNNMVMLETGFDWVFYNGLNIKILFARIDKSGLGHENSFDFRLLKSF
tara:strand:- start:2 stop:2158 length:2157 start_codon:yes stop_codon:yes gene_type:complete